MSEERVARVERACRELLAEGTAITVDLVPARTGIGRTRIYRHEEPNAIVREHRRHREDAPTLTGRTVQIDRLRHSLEAVAAKVRRHEEILRKQTRLAIQRTGRLRFPQDRRTSIFD